MSAIYHHVIHDWVSEDLGNSNARILDVGSSFGTMAKMLKASNHDVTASEAKQKHVQRLVDLGLEAVQVDLEEPAPRQLHARFEAVTCADVLEHLNDPVAGLRTMNDLIVPGGSLYLSTPNFNSYRDLKVYLKGKDATIHHNPFHVRFFNFRTIEWMLQKQGFRIEKWHRNFPVLEKLPLNFFERLPARMKDPLCRTYGIHVIVHAKKENPCQLSEWIEARTVFHQEFGF